jgi:hypothetical protein
MQLHAIYKQKPMKKFVGRERKAAVNKRHEHHPETLRRMRNDLATRGAHSMESERNPAALAFFRLPLLMVDADQPVAIPCLVDFFVIRCFTRIHKGKKLAVEVHSNGKKRDAVRVRKKKWWRGSSTCKVKVNEKGFPLNMYASKRSWAGTWHIMRKQQPTRTRENWQFTVPPPCTPVSV